jgi:deoxyribose-phosphate aldolase
MTPSELAGLLDHSVLKPEATEADVLAGATVVAGHGVGFYCVQPCWVGAAARALSATHPMGAQPARVVAVAGFPHGCERSAVKALAAARAVDDGAEEIDMVMNVGLLKSGATRAVADDIAEVVRAVPGIAVKVILEAGALTDDEKRLACRLIVESGAAFVKTSTGFHPSGGATIEDVRLMRAAVGPAFGVKAAGGIRTLAGVRAMLEAGANRIGTSASATILDELRKQGR